MTKGDVVAASLIEYYNAGFRDDVAALLPRRGEPDAFDARDIHLDRLVPGNRCRLKVATAPLFLHAFFFEVLLDQAMHSGAPERHASYDRRFAPPKFKGILATVRDHMPPSMLIAISVAHGTAMQIELGELRDFARHFRDITLSRLGEMQGDTRSSASQRGVLAAMHSHLFMAGLGIIGNSGSESVPGGARYSVGEFGERIETIRRHLIHEDDLR